MWIMITVTRWDQMSMLSPRRLVTEKYAIPGPGVETLSETASPNRVDHGAAMQEEGLVVYDCEGYIYMHGRKR